MFNKTQDTTSIRAFSSTTKRELRIWTKFSSSKRTGKIDMCSCKGKSTTNINLLLEIKATNSQWRENIGIYLSQSSYTLYIYFMFYTCIVSSIIYDFCRKQCGLSLLLVTLTTTTYNMGYKKYNFKMVISCYIVVHLSPSSMNVYWCHRGWLVNYATLALITIHYTCT